MPLNPPAPRCAHALFWLLACVLLALVQVPWAGYGLGVGNQGIQIAFLERLHNPALFASDPMVRETLDTYPSYFFRLCARLLDFLPLPTLYLLLHLIATAGVFAAVVFLAKSLFPRERGGAGPPAAWGRWGGGGVGLLAVLLLLAGHHRPLAGETLYSSGFTHTWAVFPLSLCALALFFRERYLAAFLLTGAIFNLHALEAGHLVLVMGFVSLLQVRRIGFRTLLASASLFVAAALPTLLMMLRHRQQFGGQWLQLMHVRSADHSFPSHWWQTGTDDIPRFACVLALAALAMGFPPAARIRRKIYWIAAAVGGLFLIGTLFTEWFPVPLVIRAQFFRSSRLLMILALVVIAHGCLAAWRLPWRKPAHLPSVAAWLEWAAATLIALTLAIPAMLVLLPLALLLTLVAALVSSRLAWHQALVAGSALVLCLIAWQSIQFLIPGLPPATSWGTLIDWRGQRLPTLTGGFLFAAALALWILSRRPLHPKPAILLATASTLLVAITAGLLFPTILTHSQAAGREAAWVDVQRWARTHTPPNALVLTPAQQSGFRIHSQRAVVGEWRDGTQLYFAAGFTKTWWDRMNALLPGMVLDESGKSLLAPGKSLERLEDSQVIALAKQFGADYIVLPYDDNRSLQTEFHNGVWAVYRPQVAVVSMGGGGDELVEEDKFLREIALPAIDRQRKADALIQIVDGNNQPLFGARYRLTQTTTPFGFGVVLPFFQLPAVDTRFDYKPPAVVEQELTRAAELFNTSLVSFSGQWRFMEPQRGKLNFADLDASVDWANKHNLKIQFHPLAGYAPPWFTSMAAPEQSRQLLARATTLAKRYDRRIHEWQIPTAALGIDLAAQLFTEMRKAAPHARLGIAADTRIWTPHAGAQAKLEKFAALDDLRRLREKNIKVDFIALRVRHPLGLWAAGTELYDLLDAFAKENIPIHITDFGVPVGSRIEGTVREDRWSPELQAEYYERFLTICFSHPRVEAVHFMGIGHRTWLEGQGLLNDRHAPTPAYDSLHRLITNRFRTRLSASLGVDGTAAFRGFHGNYELHLTTPDGQSARAAFALDPAASNRFRFRWDGNQLTRLEGP